MRRVDRASVKAVELKAPGACRADMTRLHKQLQNGQIFSGFGEEARAEIWRGMLLVSTNRLIPSLYSFFEDVNYLQGPADNIRRLVELSPKDTISSALGKCFIETKQRHDQYLIQITDSTFELRLGRLEDRFDVVRRQLWIGAMRNYLDFRAESEKKNKNLLAKPNGKPEVSVLRDLAHLAYRLGFESNQINQLVETSADREIARNCLLGARNPDRYRYDTAAFNEFVDQIVMFIATAQTLSGEKETTIDETEDSDGEPKRCGIPKTRDHKRDRARLFLDKLHIDDEQDDIIMSFFVRKSVYLAFFEEPNYLTENSSQVQAEDETEKQRQAILERKRREVKLLERRRTRNNTERVAEAKEKEQIQATEKQRQEVIEEVDQRQATEKQRQEATEEANQKQVDEESRNRAEEELFEDAEEELFEDDKEIQTDKENKDVTGEETTTPLKDKRLSRLWSERGELLEPGDKIPRELREIGGLQKKRLTRLKLEDLIKPTTGESEETQQLSSTVTQNVPDQLETNSKGDRDETGSERTSDPNLNITKQEVRIYFKVRKGDEWKPFTSRPVDSSKQAKVNKFTQQCRNLRKRYRLYDKDDRLLQPDTCFEDVTADGSNTIYLVPESKTDTNHPETKLIT